MAADGLQFDVAEPVAGATSPGGPPPVPGLTCAACGQPITDTYYAAGDRVVCPRCREQLVAARAGGSRAGRLGKAAGLGVVAGLVGAAVWYGIRRVTGYEIGLIAVVVGLLVGGAVRAGSGGRGGRGYQVLAVLLTYCAICANYVPDVVTALRDRVGQETGRVVATGGDATGRDATGGGPAATTPADGDDGSARSAATTRPAGAADDQDPAGGKRSAGMAVLGALLLVAIVFGLALAMPFLAGGQNIIGLLIIAFALWEAWKINTRQDADLTGPYAVGGGPGTPNIPGAPNTEAGPAAPSPGAPQ